MACGVDVDFASGAKRAHIIIYLVHVRSEIPMVTCTESGQVYLVPLGLDLLFLGPGNILVGICYMLDFWAT